MSSTREGPNPLRPYYVPTPSVGAIPETLPSSKGVRNSTSTPVSLPSASAAKASLSSSAREILSDLDYNEYLSESSPSVAEVSKRLLDQAIWKYTSVLIAQPFEVAKTILQVHVASSAEASSSDNRAGSRSHAYRYEDDVRYAEPSISFPCSNQSLLFRTASTLPTLIPTSLHTSHQRHPFPPSVNTPVVDANDRSRRLPPNIPHLPPVIFINSLFTGHPLSPMLSPSSGRRKAPSACGKVPIQPSSTPSSSKPSSPGPVLSSPPSSTFPIQVSFPVVLT